MFTGFEFHGVAFFSFCLVTSGAKPPRLGLVVWSADRHGVPIMYADHHPIRRGDPAAGLNVPAVLSTVDTGLVPALMIVPIFLMPRGNAFRTAQSTVKMFMSEPMQDVVCAVESQKSSISLLAA